MITENQYKKTNISIQKIEKVKSRVTILNKGARYLGEPRDVGYRRQRWPRER